MTGKKSTRSKESILLSEDGVHGMILDMYMHPGSITISIIAQDKGMGCVDKDAVINLLFRDGTRKAEKNSKDFNCKGYYYLMMFKKYNKETLELFRTKELAKIRVSHNEGSITKELTPAQSISLREQVRCMLEME